MQPSATASAGQRRSRASITATSTSSRCTRAPIISITASAAALRPCAIGCSHAIGSVGVAIRARARLDNRRVLASSGVLYASAVVQCTCAAAARRGWRQRTSARTAATHSCAANREKAVTARRRACCVGRAIDGVFCKGPSQANKHTNSVEPNRGSGAAAASKCSQATRSRHDAPCALRVPIGDAAAYLEETQKLDVRGVRVLLRHARK